MVPNPTPTTFIMLFLGVLTFIFIMLLPALLELKKPKDAGPRMINDYTPLSHHEIKEILIENIEENREFDQMLVKKIANLIAVLPNLEV